MSVGLCGPSVDGMTQTLEHPPTAIDRVQIYKVSP